MSKGQDKKKEDKKKPAKTLMEKRAEKRAKKEGRIWSPEWLWFREQPVSISLAVLYPKMQVLKKRKLFRRLLLHQWMTPMCMSIATANNQLKVYLSGSGKPPSSLILPPIQSHPWYMLKISPWLRNGLLYLTQDPIHFCWFLHVYRLIVNRLILLRKFLSPEDSMCAISSETRRMYIILTWCNHSESYGRVRDRLIHYN